MRGLLRLVVTMALASPLLAHSSDSSQLLALNPIGRHGTSNASDVPDDEQLKARGARIGRIDILVDDVFENTVSLSAPYRIANGLHISTHAQTVRQELLFRSGDAYDRRLLDETERLLRGERYLNDATIVPVRYNEDNTVDVLVRVHDVWTLSPGFSFGRKGGENSTRLKFEDTNFLGLGKQISVVRSSDVDRTSWRLGYVDPNLFGSRWSLSTAYSSLSDGSEKEFALERPFFALDTRWSANIGASDTTNSISRYSLGERLERFDMRERRLDLGGGFSAGLHDSWAVRYLGGFSYDDRSFAMRDDEPGVALPADRVVSYPWVGVEVMEDQYLKTRNLDQIGLTEDLYLGRSARLRLGYASTAFGSTRDAAIVEGRLQAGADLGNERYLIHSIDLHGRLEGSEIADGIVSGGSRFYLRQSPRRVLFAAASASLTSNLDPERQLLLGGDNGLRGYPLRYQAGTANALLTLEERFYTSWQPLKLVNVGAAMFFDAGRAWGHDEYAAPPSGWLTDVGFGLRLGSVRSGLGNVLHIDFAFPLNGGNDIDSMQLLIETRKSF
jgi:hypothetical protein